MFDERDSGKGGGPGNEVAREGTTATSDPHAPKYEPPRLTPLGNARDLLAGGTGTKFDAGTMDQTLP
jgi:hypothetical protein